MTLVPSMTQSPLRETLLGKKDWFLSRVSCVQLSARQDSSLNMKDVCKLNAESSARDSAGKESITAKY